MSGNKIPDKEIDKLTAILNQWQEEKSSVLQGKFTRLLNSWAKKYGSITTRETAKEIINKELEKNPEDYILKEAYKRVDFKLGFVYQDGYRVRGWISEDQVQAIPLPLEYSRFYIYEDNLKYGNIIEVSFSDYNRSFEKEREKWKALGFDVPCILYKWFYEITQELRFYDPNKKVFKSGEERKIQKVDFKNIGQEQKNHLEILGFQEAIFLPYVMCDPKYLNNLYMEQIYCELVKRKIYNGKGLYIINNLKQEGFWKAYPIWEGCHDWYKERGLYISEELVYPLSWDVVLGGQEPEPEPWDVVLGGSDRTS